MRRGVQKCTLAVRCYNDVVDSDAATGLADHWAQVRRADIALKRLTLSEVSL